MSPSHLKNYFGNSKHHITEYLKEMKPAKKKKDLDSDSEFEDDLHADKDDHDKMTIKIDAEFSELAKDARRHMKYFKDQAMALTIPGYLQHVFDIQDN
jgi:hypothetical protein